jgi:hypothetical protein
MTTKKIDPHTPMDPLYIIGFLSKSKCDKNMVRGMVNALNEYHKTCTKAAKQLDKDLKKCLKPAVHIKK